MSEVVKLLKSLAIAPPFLILPNRVCSLATGLVELGVTFNESHVREARRSFGIEVMRTAKH